MLSLQNFYRRALSLLLLGLCCHLAAVAQTAGKAVVTGIVVDSLTAEPEMYITVRAYRQKPDKPAAVCVTDEQGRFRLPLPAAGSYTIEWSSVGVSTRRTIVRATAGQTLNLGTIRLSEATANSLGEAVVTAQRAVVKADAEKLSYDIAADPESKTNTMLDMLRKVPMVTVDGDDNIKINGQSGFKVYVNGKPNAMMSSKPSDILKHYPASAVKKVEVITDPGAKYDAEGVSGILNIITDTAMEEKGWMLTPNVTFASEGIMGSVQGLTRIGKLTLSANYMAGWVRKPEQKGGADYTFPGNPDNYRRLMDYRLQPEGFFQYGMLDGSYDLSERDLLSFSGGVQGFSGSFDITGQTRMLNVRGGQTYAYRQCNAVDLLSMNYDASLDYQHRFRKERQQLTLSYRFNAAPDHTTTLATYEDIEGQTTGLEDFYSDPDKQSFENTAQLDFTTPLDSLQSLSVGLKYINRLNRSNNEEYRRLPGEAEDFQFDTDNSLCYRHRAHIAAAYAEYALNWQKVSALAGLRYEWSRFDVAYPDGRQQNFRTDFNNLVPSVSLAYAPAVGQQWKLNYNMRIGRPDIGYLSPYVDKTDPSIQKYGNPELGCEQTHNIRFSYGTFSPKLNMQLTAGYSFSNDGLTEYKYVDEQHLVNQTYENFLRSRIVAFSFYGAWTPWKGTQITANAEVNHKNLHVDQTGDGNKGWRMTLYAGLGQQLPWKIHLYGYGGFGTRDIALQGTNAAYHFYGLNFRRSFLQEDRLTVSLQAQNFIVPSYTFRGTTVTPDYRSEAWNTIPRWVVRLGFSWRLGKLKAKVKKADRTIENNDLKQAPSTSAAQGGDIGK